MELLSPGFFLLWFITIIVYYLVKRAQWVVLLFASMIGFFLLSEGFPFLVLAEAGIMYLYGYVVKRKEKARKRGLFLSITGLILLLIVFRHVLSGFLTGTIAMIFPLLGVSFYTMTAIAYCADIASHKVEPEENPAKLLLMLIYFPSILQGPIHRYDRISEELFREHSFSLDRIISGGIRALFGLMKKLVIVPRLHFYSEMIFTNQMETSFFGLISGTIVFFVELYADWSGYMDLVLGISETFGIRMAENFRRPFFSASISEVWKRWHITLSSWFRDYVYIPLGGSRKGMLSTLRNLFLVWILTALWHGTSGGYLLWGLYFAILSAIGIIFRKYGIMKSVSGVSKGGKGIRIFFTWLLTAAGFFFFAAKSFSGIRMLLAGAVTNGGFGFRSSIALWAAEIDTFETIVLCIGLLLWFFVSFAEENHKKVLPWVMERPLPIRWTILLLLIFFVILFGMYGKQYQASAFLYQGF